MVTVNTIRDQVKSILSDVNEIEKLCIDNNIFTDENISEIKTYCKTIRNNMKMLVADVAIQTS